MRACFWAFLLARLPAVWLWLVGLGRVELPTSPLSGVRSNQLSYRPSIAGGADRDRTDDLLSANQALSQLSYSPLLCLSLLLVRVAPPSYAQTDNRFRGQLNARPGVQLTGTINFKSKMRRETRSRNARRSAPSSSYFPVHQGAAHFSLRKEVIQPQVLLRLPCYDFTPIMSHTLGRCLLAG
jgi:hypothetical protein